MGAGWIAVAVALAVALGLFNNNKKPKVPPAGPALRKAKEEEVN